jgi:hypothetical protein
MELTMSRPCLNLCSKELSYRPAGSGPALPSEHDHCWCLLTQTGRGPDDQPADAKSCCSPERGCYAGLDGIV